MTPDPDSFYSVGSPLEVHSTVESRYYTRLKSSLLFRYI